MDPWFPPPQFFPQIDEKSTLTATDKEECRNPMSFGKIYVPHWFGKIIAVHIEKMHKMGYFDRITPQDFDHGHLLLYLSDNNKVSRFR
jgi:hypothetical protein